MQREIKSQEMDDPRFGKLFSDPKFRNVPKKEKKVKIDQRFQSLFKDKKFVSKASVDKRGRPGNFSTKENYEKFYQMSSDSEDSDDDSKSKKDDTKAKKNLDYARGEAFLTDSSSEEDSSASEDEKEEESKQVSFSFAFHSVQVFGSIFGGNCSLHLVPSWSV